MPRLTISTPGVSGTVLLCAYLLGCRPAQLYHFDETLFILSENPVSFDGGWIAVDDSHRGAHALVQLEVEATAGDPNEPLGKDFGILVGEGVGWGVDAFTVEGPVCRPRGLPLNENGSFTGQEGNCSDTYCAYILRGEFELLELPTPGDTVLIRHRGRVTPVVWPTRN